MKSAKGVVADTRYLPSVLNDAFGLLDTTQRGGQAAHATFSSSATDCWEECQAVAILKILIEGCRAAVDEYKVDLTLRYGEGLRHPANAGTCLQGDPLLRLQPPSSQRGKQEKINFYLSGHFTSSARSTTCTEAACHLGTALGDPPRGEPAQHLSTHR